MLYFYQTSLKKRAFNIFSQKHTYLGDLKKNEAFSFFSNRSLLQRSMISKNVIGKCSMTVVVDAKFHPCSLKNKKVMKKKHAINGCTLVTKCDGRNSTSFSFVNNFVNIQYI